MSSSIVSSIASVSIVSSCVGAAGGAAHGAGGVAVGAGGVGARAVKRKSVLLWVQGTCVPAGFVPSLGRRMGRTAARACEAAVAVVGTLGSRLGARPRRMARCL
eukprot:2065211-Pleurochrysis_carterae.AAC.1